MPALLEHCGDGERVNGALRDHQDTTATLHRERESLVAALHFQFKLAAADRPLHRIARCALRIPANKHGVVVAVGLIERSVVEAACDDIVGDASACEIGDHARWIRETRRESERDSLRIPIQWPRADRYARAAKRLHRRDKIHALHMDQIVQRRLAADASAVPVPQAIGDLQAVMGSGGILLTSNMDQLIRFKLLQIGQQIQLFCLLYE